MLEGGLEATQIIAFVLAGVVSGGVNALAGGGSLVSFPILLSFGIPSVAASATNTASLAPGGIAAVAGLRSRLPGAKDHLKLLLIPTLCGTLLGAYLLTRTSTSVFDQLVPILILTATVVLALRPVIVKWSQKLPRVAVWAVIVQFVVAVYGGFFGAGMGILMLAVIGLIHPGDTHDTNVVKNVLGLIINFAAAVLLGIEGKVLWLPALAMGIGSMLGGYGAARYSLRIPPEVLRWCVVVYGLVMGIKFIFR